MKKLFPRLAKLLGEKGMSMAEVMVATGAAAGLSLVLAQLSKNAATQQSVVSAKNDFEVMTAQINSVVSNPTACGNTTSGLNAAAITAMSSANGHPITQIRDKTNAVVFQTLPTPTKLGKATVKTLILKNYNAAADTVNLEITATYLADKRTVTTKKKIIPINIDATAVSVTYCAAGSNADVGPWEKMSIPSMGIYYNQGSVLIGSGTADTSSANPSFAMGTANTVTAQYSAVFGSSNNLGDSARLSYAFGSNNSVSAPTSFVVGDGNNVNTINNTLVFGNQNQINGGGNDTLVNIVLGNENMVHGELQENNYVIGRRNEFHGQVQNNYFIGENNQSHSTSRNYLIGNMNAAHGTAENNFGFGGNNNFHGASAESVSLGFDNNFNDGIRSFALGAMNTVGSQNSVAIGTSNSANGAASIAIGRMANATAAGSMVLSDGSNNAATSTIANTFLSRFNGGYTFQTSMPLTEAKTMVLGPAGRVGIGETSPTGKFEVRHTGATGDVLDAQNTRAMMRLGYTPFDDGTNGRIQTVLKLEEILNNAYGDTTYAISSSTTLNYSGRDIESAFAANTGASWAHSSSTTAVSGSGTLNTADARDRRVYGVIGTASATTPVTNWVGSFSDSFGIMRGVHAAVSGVINTQNPLIYTDPVTFITQPAVAALYAVDATTGPYGGSVGTGQTYAGYFHGKVKITNGLEQNAWAAIPYGAGYTTKAGYGAASYMKDTQGFVHLRGAISDNSGLCRIGTTWTLGTLPVGFRPSSAEIFTVAGFAQKMSAPAQNFYAWQVTVNTNGTIQWTVPPGETGTCGIEWFSLSGITFRP